MANIDVKDNLVTCQSSQGVEIRASLLRLSRHEAVFEIYTPGLVLHMSEVLGDFRVLVGDRTVYSGRAVVSNAVSTGTMVVCEARLDEAALNLTPLGSAIGENGSLQAYFNEFVREWQKYSRVLPEFKSVMGDMQSYLAELRLWLDQIELEIRSWPSGDRLQLERQVVDQLAPLVINGIDSFIVRFEALAESLDDEAQPVHRAYLRRQLHPLILCSPFAYRTFQKPLGYAGDYEVVDMMMRPPYEGSTLFAKIINVWLLGQAPVLAHRNRVEYLRRKLFEQAVQARSRGRTARVYNLGCGPAAEIQQCLTQEPLCDQLQFTLLDFNQETLDHARRTLEALKAQHGRSTAIQYVKRSVQQVLKEGSKPVPRMPGTQYDFVYCAGLFDYLSDAICRRLMNIFYDSLAPGGLLVATNVSDALNRSRPFRYSMEYILDWRLIYRNGPQVRSLAPERAPEDNVTVLAEDTGVNVFLEVRRPADA